MSETTIDDRSVSALLAEAVRPDPSLRLFAIPDSFGSWFDLGAAEYLDRVRALAGGFLAADLSVGDAIGVLCSTRFEATLVDHAAWMIGVSVVPLDADRSQSDLQAQLDDLPVRAVVVETARDFARFDEIHGDLSDIVDVWQIGLGDLDKLSELGRGVDVAVLDEQVAVVDGSAVALHLHDSEGAPLPISQGSLVDGARRVAGLLGETGESSTLRLLPATDVFAHLTTLVAVAVRARLGHVDPAAPLLPALASFRPTFLLAYPETFHDIEAATESRAETTGRGAALRQALEVAREHSEALSTGVVPRGLKTRFTLADALVYRGLRKAVGGRLRVAVVIASEASLPSRMRHIMRSLDVRAIEGLGVACIGGFATLEHTDDPFDRPAGGVGAALPGIGLDVHDDGSVVVRTDGGPWHDSGLVGELDDAGRLTLDGR